MKKIFIAIVIVMSLGIPSCRHDRVETDMTEMTNRLFKLSLEELLQVRIIRQKRGFRTEPETWVLVMLKVISLDTNNERFGSPIVIAIDTPEVYEVAKSLENKVHIGGRKFCAEELRSINKDPEEFENKVVFLGKNYGDDRYTKLMKMTDAGCFIFTTDEQSAVFGYASVLLKTVEDTPRVAINLDNAKDSGAHFNSDDIYYIAFIKKD